MGGPRVRRGRAGGALTKPSASSAEQRSSLRTSDIPPISIRYLRPGDGAEDAGRDNAARELEQSRHAAHAALRLA